MLKSYSHNNLKKERCVEAIKRPFFSLLGSRGQALSASGLGWVWTEADHLELNGFSGEAIGADPKRACAFMACVCRTQVLAMARPAVGFLSMPRGLLQPVPMAALLAWEGRLCSRNL